MNRAVVSAAAGLAALAAACQSPSPTPPPAIALPAISTSTATLGPWSARLTALRGDLLGADRATIRADLPLADAAPRGRPAVLAFWATYCPPCIAEMPMFEALHRAGHPVVGVSLDADQRAEALEVLDRQQVTYPNLVLDVASMKRAGRALESGLPFTLILDPRGQPAVGLFQKTEREQVLAGIRHALP